MTTNKQHKANDEIQISMNDFETASVLAEDIAKTCLGIKKAGQGARIVESVPGLEKLANQWLKKNGKTARIQENYMGESKYHFMSGSYYEPVFN